MKSYLHWGPEPFEDYASMMVFDALICNTDRHLTNFGVLRNSRTGDMQGLGSFVRNRTEQLLELPEVSREELLARCPS